VTGPAIDHSAVPGEVFTEEFKVGSFDVNIEWSVLERESPSSINSPSAQFTVEGTAQVEGRRAQHWREVMRLRSGIHQYAKTPQVHVSLELLIDGGTGGSSKEEVKWKRRVQKKMKNSLKEMRSRVEELKPSKK